MYMQKWDAPKKLLTGMKNSSVISQKHRFIFFPMNGFIYIYIYIYI